MEDTKNIDTIDKDNYKERKRLYEKDRSEFDRSSKEFQKQKQKVEDVLIINEKNINRLRNKISKRQGIGVSIIVSCLILICLLSISYFFQGYLHEMKLYDAKKESEEEFANKTVEYRNKAAQIITMQNNMLASKIQEEHNAELSSMVVEKNNSDAIRKYIADLERYPSMLLQRNTTLGGKSYYIYTDIIELSNYYISDSGIDTVFPGAIIKGESLFQNNAYALVSVDRAPVNLTANHGDGYSIEVDNPDYSTVSDALRAFQTDINDQNAKEWVYDIKMIESTEELNATLGVSGKAGIGSLNIGISSSQENSAIAVIFKQTYYTVVANPKQSSADYFQDGTNLDCLGYYEPVYVSSVDYGRMVTLLITSNMSKDKLSAEVGACFTGVGINVGLEKLEKMKDVNISYAFYGGKTDDISLVVGNDGQENGLIGKITTFFTGDDKETAIDRINAFIDSNSDLVNPVPVSYELKYLSDNSVVPAMTINRQEVFAADNAKLVRIDLADNSKKNIEFTLPDGTMIIDDNSFLWDERMPFLLDGTYAGNPFSIFVDAYASGKLSYSIKKNFFQDTELNLYISEVKEQ